ncbi:MAG: response regulator [Gammaproteobacteria bacterium]|nr:response regulator [Gammaproteobacteria bacterium]
MQSILVLDDEPIVRQSLVDYFEDRAWDPLEADSGEAALLLLENGQPDAAIVDIRLPGMDGNEFIRSACRRYPRMVFLICTGSPEFTVPQDLQAEPNVCNEIFRKPVDDLARLESETLRLIGANAH